MSQSLRKIVLGAFTSSVFNYCTHHCSLLMVFVQGPEQPAADLSLRDGGGHTGSEEPETLCRGSRSQLVRALSQLPAGEAARALLHTHLHTHTGEVHAGNTKAESECHAH